MAKFQIKYILLAVFLIGLLIVPALFLLGYYSQKQPPRPQPLAKLAPCPASMNCVCSECPRDGAHYIEAIDLADYPGFSDVRAVLPVLTGMGGETAVQKPGYIAATFKSRLFGFVDDFELRLDQDARKLHIRSASRVGLSDMGANRHRAEAFKKQFRSRFR